MKGIYGPYKIIYLNLLKWKSSNRFPTVEITWYFQIAHNENKLYNTYSHIVTEIDYSNQQHCVDQLWGIEWIYMLQRFVAFRKVFWSSGQVATLWEVTFLVSYISYANENNPVSRKTYANTSDVVRVWVYQIVWN